MEAPTVVVTDGVEKCLGWQLRLVCFVSLCLTPSCNNHRIFQHSSNTYVLGCITMVVF
jgi:hypothetical protein